MTMGGIFITLEGPEGSGKSTQAGRLTARLRGLGYEVVSTREPGGTATGEAIRSILQHNDASESLFAETEALLFAASRAQLVRSVIIPALESGKCVVCDRFADSTTAYQGYGRGFDISTMLAINAFAINNALPDITILLDIDVRYGFERLRKRNRERKTEHDRIESEDMEFHERVRAGYLDLYGTLHPDELSTGNQLSATPSTATAVRLLSPPPTTNRRMSRQNRWQLIEHQSVRARLFVPIGIHRPPPVLPGRRSGSVSPDIHHRCRQCPTTATSSAPEPRTADDGDATSQRDRPV